jgi:hypothetical protein
MGTRKGNHSGKIERVVVFPTIVLRGPCGVGKTTLSDALVEDDPTMFAKITVSRVCRNTCPCKTEQYLDHRNYEMTKAAANALGAARRGKTAIVDSNFANQKELDQFLLLLGKVAWSPDVVLIRLHASKEILRRRLMREAKNHRHQGHRRINIESIPGETVIDTEFRRIHTLEAMTAEAMEPAVEWSEMIGTRISILEDHLQHNYDRVHSQLAVYEEAFAELFILEQPILQLYTDGADNTPLGVAFREISHRGFHEFQAAWFLLSRGFYTSACSSLRGILESWIALTYFSHFPQDGVLWNPKYWGKEALSGKEQSKLRIGAMRRALAKANLLPKEMEVYYSLLSSMVHVTSLSALSTVTHDGSHPLTPRVYFLRPMFHEGRFRLIASLLLDLSWKLLNASHDKLLAHLLTSRGMKPYLGVQGEFDKLRLKWIASGLIPRGEMPESDAEETWTEFPYWGLDSEEQFIHTRSRVTHGDSD